MTFAISGVDVEPGEQTIVHFALPPLPNGAAMTLPVAVLHGAKPGPTGFVTAAVHGDEINGVAIVRRLLETLVPSRMHGTLLLAPTVDVYGFNSASRYLPDRRDLNRSFPGSAAGSIASQLAHHVTTEIVHRCSFGIDLHTGSNGRSNHPQVRGQLRDPAFVDAATAFGAPLTINSEVIDGSLRQTCANLGVNYLIYEAGEAGRFDPASIDIGTAGTLRVIGLHGLIPISSPPPSQTVSDTHWLRAPRSGIFTFAVELGQRVEAGTTLGEVTDTFGLKSQRITAESDSIVIGLAVEPPVEAGDALVHLGW